MKVELRRVDVDLFVQYEKRTGVKNDPGFVLSNWKESLIHSLSKYLMSSCYLLNTVWAFEVHQCINQIPTLKEITL